jgi:hypothetical protein
METILREIDRALNLELYYVAVVMALTLPDICAALESPDGETSGPQYQDWFNANLACTYPRMTALDCYKLRCGVLHQGRCGHPQMQFSRVIFTLPDPARNQIHNNITRGPLNLDAVLFCQEVMAAVRQWFVAKANDPNVLANLPRLVQLHPRALPPHVIGVAVIA